MMATGSSLIFPVLHVAVGEKRGRQRRFFQCEIAEAASRYEKEIDEKRRIIVGFNEFVDEGEERDADRAEAATKALREAIRSEENLMEPVLECVRGYTTMSEIVELMKNEYATWGDTEIF